MARQQLKLEGEAVLTIGLFDGIGALRVAADSLGLGVIGHISVEVKKEASRVLESRFPSTLFVEGDEEMVRPWAARYSQAAVVIIGPELVPHARG